MKSPFLKIVVVGYLLLSFANCGKKELEPFHTKIFQSIDDHVQLTLISVEELELRKGNTTLLCKYTKQRYDLRVIATAMGANQVMYFRETTDGFQDPDGNILLSEAAYAATKERQRLAQTRKEPESNGLSATTPLDNDELLPPKVKLSRGVDTIVYLYEPDEPRAVCVFGSGDNGWSEWEGVISGWMADAGIYVVGWDYPKYAKGNNGQANDEPHKANQKEFTADDIGSDMAIMAKLGLDRVGKPDLPVFYSGWGSSAAVAVPAAAWKSRPAKLVGLMLFGLHVPDRIEKTPLSTLTYDLSQYEKAVTNLRVVQFHGGADILASKKWIQTLKSPHALYEIPHANHGFDGPAPWFQVWMADGIEWLLGDNSKAPENR